MSKSVQEVYCKAMRRHFKDFAHWHTEVSPSIGDYGLIEKDKFLKVGNIFDENKDLLDKSKFNIQETLKSSNQYFNNGCKIVPKLKGDLIGEIDIEFTYEDAVFFYSQFSKQVNLHNIRLFGVEVMNYARSFWDKNYAIVTAISYGKNTTVCASTTRNSSITLGISKENLTSIDLGNFGGKFDIKASVSIKQEGILTQDTPEEIPLLLQLHQIRSRLWMNESFDRLQLPNTILENELQPEVALKEMELSEENFLFLKI